MAALAWCACAGRPATDASVAPGDARAPDGGAPPRDAGTPPLDTPAPPPDGAPPVDDVPAPPDDLIVPDATADDAPVVHTDGGAGDTVLVPVRDPPALRRYSGGACPRLVSGPTAATSLNMDFRSGSQTRRFRVLVPRTYDPAGSDAWPVMFAWHWLNASGSSFIREGELETAVEQMRIIAVVPEALENSSGDNVYRFTWPFVESWGVDGELTFFDDMLACVSEQFRVDRRRVYGVGVSAGALWVSFLSSTDRIDYLAAVASLSGGLGELTSLFRMEFTPRPNKFPALVLWGGPGDSFILDFHRASLRYRDALLADRHFVVQCVHTAGHAMPPIDPPPDGGTRFRSIWQFFLDHPYGLPAGESPYRRTGLPAGFPSWCGIPLR